VCVCVCVYIHVVVRSNLWKKVVLRGSVSYVATRSVQINVEVADDVDPKYQLNPCSIIIIQLNVGDVWIGVVWVCILIFV